MDKIQETITILYNIGIKFSEQLSTEELQAISDGISALKTIDDMQRKGR